MNVYSDNPLVSIITVVFNGEKYLEQTILSVLNQTYKNIEYIIIDGGSTDSSVDIIKKYNDKISFWVSEKDNGIYDAMNKGIAQAKGEIIGIINSDDWYEVDCVEHVVEIFNKEKKSVIYGLMRHIENNIPFEVYAAYPSSISKKMLPHSTCFIPKSIYIEYGVFNLKYNYCADYELLLRLYSKDVNFIIIEKILANFRIGGVSTKFKALKEAFAMRYNLGFISYSEKMYKTIGVFFKNKLLSIKK